jgi:hypothetical protein
MMPDPEIQTPAEFQFYVQQNGVRSTRREFERGSIQGLEKSLSKAHDNLQTQVGINTRLYVSLARAQKRLDWANLKMWILAGALGAEGAVLLVLWQVFLEHVK